jgi:hypothetical protein
MRVTLAGPSKDGGPPTMSLRDPSPGPLGHVINRRDRATPGLKHICQNRFLCFVCSIRFSKEREMRRIDLVEATMQGWARLDPQQRERFFKAGLRAALRLKPQQFRAWLLRRVRQPPLAAPIDLARFAISDRDMALLLKQLPLRADDADGGTRL